MKRLALIFIVLIAIQSFGKVTPAKVVRVANETTAFDETIPRGTIIFDVYTGRAYIAYLGLASTKTISSCTINSDIVEITNTNVDDASTNATYYPLFASSIGNNNLLKVSSTKLTYNPSTGILVSTNFQLSDERLKENIRPVTDFARYADIVFHQFTYKSDSKKVTHVGVIAQEVEKIVPQLVNTDDKGMKSVNYIELLTAVVAQQRDAIEKLEKRIAVLEKTTKKKWKAEKCTVSLP